MKKGLRFALVGTVLTAAITTLAPSSNDYEPRIQSEQGAAGEAAYLHSLRENQVTGTIDKEDISSAIQSL